MDGVFHDVDAAEMGAVIVAQELVVIAGDVDDLGALAGLAQQLLHEIIVRLRPVPVGLQRPAVDDIANQIDRVGVVVAQEIQQTWISAGMKILCGNYLSPRLWVAPRHGFDWNTLVALRREGIEFLSDGFSRVAFTRGGLTWIPQQLWSPVEKSQGLWTICMHSNTASDGQVEQLKAFLQEHAAQFTSVDRVVNEMNPVELSTTERIYEVLAQGRMLASRLRRELVRRILRQSDSRLS